MKSVETTKTGKNFTAVSVGKLSEVKNYVLQLGDIQIPGKVFVGQALGTTGSELSFQTFAPGQDGGFLHTHKNHEELYFILRGEGLYQVDGENIPVGEGSIIRVAPRASAPSRIPVRKRCLCSACSIRATRSRQRMPQTV